MPMTNSNADYDADADVNSDADTKSDVDADDQYKEYIYHARHALPHPSHYIPPIPLYPSNPNLSLQSQSTPPIPL